MPHVAPVHGGTSARLLWGLRDPGPATTDPEHHERRFLCLENDDATAGRLCILLDDAGIRVADTLPWNAYPWYINRKPSTEELRAGVDPLRRLLHLLPDLRIVLLLGTEARRCWGLLQLAAPEEVAGLEVLSTRHTSAQAFIGSTEQRQLWRAEQQRVFADASHLLAPSSPGRTEVR
jgi:hypothetical protein